MYFSGLKPHSVELKSQQNPMA
uniref:Uncharacterized protein n=1 Tax=Arundo donax TaxID=35708 RepID=A0A0A9AFZ3_ARUDO